MHRPNEMSFAKSQDVAALTTAIALSMAGGAGVESGAAFATEIESAGVRQSTALDQNTDVSYIAGALKFVPTYRSTDLNQYAKLPTRPDEFAYFREKLRLRNFITKLSTSQINPHGINGAAPSQGATETALMFLTKLPMGTELPKIAVDSEGDFLFAWGADKTRCVLTLEDKLLHLVTDPGTDDVTYYDDMGFVDAEIPSDVLNTLSKFTA